jgi:hypothetical protein
MSVYHLHIPRTSGIFIREFAVHSLPGNIFSRHNRKLPNNFSEYDIVSGHFATTPIKDTDVNFAIFRNPVDLTFSYISYHLGHYPHLTFSELVEMYIDTGKIENFVNINSKFLTGEIDIEKYNDNISNLLYRAESCWFVKNYDTDILSFSKTIEKNKTILIDFDDTNRYDKISDILGVKIVGNKINQSRPIKDRLRSKYNNLITELNSFDLEAYEYLKKQT